MKKHPSPTISIAMDKVLQDRIKKQADLEDRSVSNLIRRAVILYLKNTKK